MTHSGPNVYERFIEEVEALTIKADMPAVAVVGELTRAVRRAQLVFDHALAPVAARGDLVAALEVEPVIPVAAAEDDEPLSFGDIVGHCSKCGEVREAFYTCRDGGETIPKADNAPE